MIVILSLFFGFWFILIGINIVKIKWKDNLTEKEIHKTKITLLICGLVMIIGSIIKYLINR